MRFYFLPAIFILLLSKLIYASTAGQLVSVIGSGGEGPLDVIICLNGQSQLSCQQFHVTGGYSLQITPSVPSHYYPAMSIEIQTQGIAFQSGCTSYVNNRCVFSASQATPAVIDVISTEEHSDSQCLGANPICRLFVSNSTTTGNIATGTLIPANLNTACGSNDPISRANCICAAEALSLGYSGQWRAWLSTNMVNARDNIHYNAQTTFVRADNPLVTVANPGSLLISSTVPLVNSPSSNDVLLYTGTNPDGSSDSRSCSYWTSENSSDQSVIGSSTHVDESWTSTGLEQCNVYHPIYCFESLY